VEQEAVVTVEVVEAVMALQMRPLWVLRMVNPAKQGMWKELAVEAVAVA
jgi:hypothetical protein